MSVWSFAELDDSNWVELGMNDDHIVPHQAGELAYGALDLSGSYKKQRCEVKNVGKHMFSRGCATKTALWGKEDTYYPPMKNQPSAMLEGPWSQASNVVVPALCSTDYSARDTSLPSQDLRVSDYDVDDSDMLMHRSMFCSKNPIQGTAVSTNENRSGLSSLNAMSSNVTDLSFLQNKRKDRDSDRVQNDWPGISNFEDVDKMFSDWDSTFGQGQTGIEDEMSWFSSTSKAQGSADNDKSFSSVTDGLSDSDAQSKDSSANDEKLCDRRDKMQNIGLSHLSSEYYLDESQASTVMIERQRSSEEKETKLSTDQMILDTDVSDVSASQMYSSQQYPQQKHCIVSSSNYMQNVGRSSQVEFGFSKHQCPERLPDQFYMAQIMAQKKNKGKLYQRQQLTKTMTTEHLYQQPSFRNKASDQEEQHETGDDSEMEDMGTELPTLEIHHPEVRESSGMNSVISDEVSEKVTGFQQLQDVMHQLDARTKLCIRDSLYRLARSAGQRHDLATQDCSTGTTNTNENQCTEASQNKLTNSANAETNTNPMDRSIAHLLFHRLQRLPQGRLIIPDHHSILGSL